MIPSASTIVRDLLLQRPHGLVPRQVKFITLGWQKERQSRFLVFHILAIRERFCTGAFKLRLALVSHYVLPRPLPFVLSAPYRSYFALVSSPRI